MIGTGRGDDVRRRCALAHALAIAALVVSWPSVVWRSEHTTF